jgi:hypothetical protein
MVYSLIDYQGVAFLQHCIELDGEPVTVAVDICDMGKFELGIPLAYNNLARSIGIPWTLEVHDGAKERNSDEGP